MKQLKISMNDEIRGEIVSVQIETSKNPKNEKEKEMKIKFKNCMHKEKDGIHMEDYICVGFFIVSMIIQKLILGIHKSCIVSFVIKNL
jgi:hypothetical protein